MKTKSIFFLLTVCAIFISSPILSQSTYIDAGPDVFLSAGTGCADLHAIYQSFGCGNTYLVDSIPYNIPCPYDGGTGVSVNTDDIWSNTINLPFNFNFFGQNYNQVILGSNGVLSFDVNYAGGYCPWSFTNPIPNSSLPMNAVFGAYLDIDPSVSGYIYYKTIGTTPNRLFVFSFDSVCYFSCSSLKTSQMTVLHETTNIIDIFIEDHPVCTSWNNGNAVIGVQDENGTIGIAAPGRNTGNWTATMEGWRFFPVDSVIPTIQWYDEAGNFVDTGENITVCPITTTTYLAIFHYGGCVQLTDSDYVTVFVDGVNAGEDDTVCGLTYSLQAQASSDMISCYWDTVAGVSFTNQTSPVTQIQVSTPGNYQFVFNNITSSATIKDTVNITFHQIPTSGFTVSGINCFGDTAIITYTGNASTNATYLWNTDNGFPVPGSGQGPFSVSWDTASTHQISLTVTENGCTSTPTIILAYNPEPLITNVISDTLTCGSSSVITTTTGGTQPYSYTWSNGSGTNFITGTYYVTTTDANNCQDIDTFTVINSFPITVTLQTINPLCFWTNEGSIEVNVNGGNPPYAYEWSNNSNFHDSVQTQLYAGTYTITVTDTNNCEIITSYTLTQPQQLNAELVSIQDVTCNGGNDGELTVTGNGGTPPYTYFWSSTNQTPTVSNLTVGNYFITVNDANGCTAYNNFVVNEPGTIILTFNTTDASSSSSNDGSATAYPNGGTPSYSYLWVNGQTVPTIDSLSQGWYQVTVFDDSGCQISDSVYIDISTSIEQENSPNDFLLYPNPARDHLTVIITNEKLQITNVTILDVTGKQVKNEKLKGQNKISISGLPAGMYFLKVETDKGTVVKKFVKQ